MTWTTTRNPDAFEAAAGAFLRGRPAAHTVLLSAASALRTIGPDAYGDEAPVYGWWRPAGRREAAAAFLWTPPRPVVLSPMPDGAAAGLADVLARERFRPARVNGARPAAEAFAAAWQQRHGGTVRTAARHRLHRLAELTPPRPAPPGAARPATPADRDLLIDWFAAFAAEIGDPPPRDARALDERIADGRCLLWEYRGRPVSWACVTRTLAGMARVAPVHTVRELRGRGFGGAVTAAVSAAARSFGAQEVVLFADLANATSNALYRRVGYRAVEDHAVLEFDAGAVAGHGM
ncbi:GNAT family N-acetyltransferase [Streptomyces sp. NRRL S-1448]|uniref:GNAT family N-acetyltransferase n=1 Tax=Streptomyces sp. NRRL S-1448 TaxID=1463883 RepID=UPI0004BF002E|nr:GNAT family N-acetyltransferase [Streptomyces sp. NRRL S-1448]